MSTGSKKGFHREIHKIVGVYALFGSAWIYFSDSVLYRLITDPALRARIEVFKGLIFILITSALLYQLIGRFARRNAETIDRLAQSEARFQTIYHNVSDALFIQNPAGGVVDVNRTMCNMFGYSRPEALQMEVQELSAGQPPYSQREAMERVALAVKGIPQGFEWRSKKKDGTLFWTEISMRSATIDGEDRVIVMVRDIDDRKKAQEALRQSEEILKVLMEEMPAGVGWSDEEGRIQYLNEFLKGSLRDWMAGSETGIATIDDLLLFALPDPAYRARIRDSWYRAMARSRESGSAVPPTEVKVECSDGSIRHLFLNTRLVCDRILFIFTDITKWEEMQSEILKAQKLESLGVLAGGIAHDFNNILTGILGNISFASLILDQSHPARRQLEQAEKASMRAAELAHQLLTFAKGGQPVKKRVSLPSLVQESAELVLHGSKVKAALDLPESLHAIEADEGQLNQAFNNVIINAMQAMTEGGTVTIKGENLLLDEENPQGLLPGGYVKLSFSDHGIGISHQDLQRIFDPYFTTKTSGSGLGLASVHSIISKHSGKVEVESSLGIGTTFTFYLPSTGDSSSATEADQAPAAPSEPRAAGAILVMDDEETIRELAVDMLQYLGFDVITCRTGEEAVQLYQEADASGHPFFAAIMDLTVPAGMGGKEAAQQILSQDPDARLIVSSGYSNDPVVARYKEFGFCAAVVKPYRPEEIREALREAGRECRKGRG
jgi:two-component system, cell cycle sensor histidine kinase and response regulator CckA